MTVETGFTEQERELLLDLLLREERELPAEIHHSRNNQVHEMLTARLKLVRSLLERMQQNAPVMS